MKHLAIIVLLISLTTTMAGCDSFEPKVPSPRDGRPVNASQLQMEYLRIEQEKAAEDVAAKAKAEREQRAAKAAADAALADLDARAEIDAATAKAARANIIRDYGVKREAISAGYLADQTNRDAAARSLDQMYQSAVDSINSANARNSGLLAAGIAQAKNIPVVGQAFQAFGLDQLIGTLAGALGIGGGAAVVLKRSKDKAIKTTKAEAEEARKREHEAWDEATRLAKDEAARQQQQILLAVMARFDTNKNGRLDPDELAKVNELKT